MVARLSNPPLRHSLAFPTSVADSLARHTEGHTNPLTAKTACSVVRYQPDEVVALLDSTQAGKTAGELLGIGGNTPIVATLAEAPTANTLLIGIAPMGVVFHADQSRFTTDRTL